MLRDLHGFGIQRNILAILFFAKPFEKGVQKAIGLSLAFTIFALIGYSTHLYIPIRSELNPIIDENDPEIGIRDEQGNLQLGNLFKLENWQKFNDFVERKQYGSESMINRAFHRRSQVAHQLLSFPNMSYGGYQMAQYLPFKVGGVSYDRSGAYYFDKADNVPLRRFGIDFPTQMSFMGDDIAPQFIIFLIFNGLIVLVCVFVWRRNMHLGVFVSLLYVLCSLGLVFYINFADGTRMEKRDYDDWKAEVTKGVAEFNRRGIKVAVPDPNEVIDLRQKIERSKMFVNSLRQRGASASEIAMAEKQVKAYESSPAWVNWKKIENSFARFQFRIPALRTVHMEVRERDYFYTPAFIFMSMIFGIGAGILVLLCATGRRPALGAPVAAALVLVSFSIPLASNYKEHDRSGLWVPWDYAYNLLNSCRPNAILFTNGDNDTFPLWFAQEVAGIRKDVRVVNLSLGNTEWYIKQMLDNEPILKLSYTKETIDRDMVYDNSAPNNPDHFTQTWITRAQKEIGKARKAVDSLEALQLTNADTVLLQRGAQAAQDRVELLLHAAVVQPVLPQRGGQVLPGDAGALLVHEIGKDLLALRQLILSR